MEGKFFSDVIDFDKHIKSYRLIEIISGIGSGKTTWVEELANTEIDGHKPNILFITSRKAVANAAVLKYKNSNPTRWINLEDEYERHGLGVKKQKICYCTNSGIQQFFEDKYSPNDEHTFLWNYFDFIILDEAHSLSTDAVFLDNPFYVERFIKYAVHENPNCRVILMTGTHEPIDWVFREGTKKNSEYACWDFLKECRHVEPKEVWLDTKYKAEKELVQYVLNGNRVVYFASSVSRIKDLRDKLMSMGIEHDSIGIAFAKNDKHNEMFTSEDIQAKEHLAKHIAAHECLPDNIKVFLSTSQNKEGITISNDDIYYMFAESTSMCELRQMAGRVRNSKVSDQLKVFHVVYDNPYQNSQGNIAYEEVRDTHYLKHLNNGFNDLKERSENYAEKSIEDVEKAFSNIRYDFLYKKEFILYQGRIEGKKQQENDDTKLRKCIEEWDAIDGYGRDEFQKWFPYSKVELKALKKDKHQLVKELRADVTKYLTEHEFLDKRIPSESLDIFKEWLNEYLKDFDCKTVEINMPIQNFGSKVKQTLGIEIKSSTSHKTNDRVITLLHEGDKK